MIRNSLTLLFLITFFASSCSKKQAPAARPPVGVSVVRIQPHTVPQNFEYIGVGESSHIVELRARVEGYLEKIAYKEGSLVKTGDLMFVLDQRPFIAAVESSQGVLERQKALLWNAQQIEARMIPLYEQNAISQRDLDNAIADELAAKANVDTAAADLYKAQINLGFASISSPVTGMSNQAKYREGALISPGAHSLLTTIYVIDPIWVNFSVSDSDLLNAAKDVRDQLLQWPEGMNFSIEAILSDGTVVPAKGKIDFTNPALQQSTGTMLMRAVLPNPSAAIRPGQFVRVVVKGAIRPNAILVPQNAVIQGSAGTFVYIVGADGKAQSRPVTVGEWYENYWIIHSGLNTGDLVIGEGVNKIQNGTPVTIQKMLPELPTIKSNTGTLGNSAGW